MCNDLPGRTTQASSLYCFKKYLLHLAYFSANINCFCKFFIVILLKPSMTGYGIENSPFFGVKIWLAMPSSSKESQTLNSFKGSIKNHPSDFNCRLYIRFVEN